MSENIAKIKAELLFPSNCTLAESPLWHKERNSCFWVDIEGCRIYEYDWLTKDVKQYELAQRVSLIVQGNGDELILGLQGGVGRYNLATQQLEWIRGMEVNWKTHRCNDGGCDSKGRLWVGTMELTHKTGAGALYCIDVDGRVERKIEHVSISNGMAWANDNKRLYYIDSPTRRVDSYLYDEGPGDIKFERTVIHLDKNVMPDGMTIDEEGMLWVALWGGFGVGRFDVNSGEMLSFIELPVPQVTSCAFVGEKLDQLLITTARENMTAADISKYPQSGNIFIAQAGVSGVPDNRCAL